MSTYEDQFEVEQLVAALIGRHRSLFLNDAEFHATVRQLARLLPRWIDGIAAVCKERSEDRAEQLQAILNAPPTSFLLPPQPTNP